MEPTLGQPTAGLVLAAGAGRRYGMPKALVAYEGERLVERAARTLAEGGCAPVIVVLGAAAPQVRGSTRLAGHTVVENPHWRTGMGSSLRAGLAALAGTRAAAAIVLLVDMPWVSAEAVRRLARHAAPDRLAMAGYGDRQHQRRGHPVLLGRDHWAGVAKLATGDAGARAYLRRHSTAVQVVACGDVADDRDLDRPLDQPG